MKRLCTSPFAVSQVVSTFARHWETGEPLSENKIQDLCRAKRMFAASVSVVPNSKVHGANVGLIWGWQDTGRPYIVTMNLVTQENAVKLLFFMASIWNGTSTHWGWVMPYAIRYLSHWHRWWLGAGTNVISRLFTSIPQQFHRKWQDMVAKIFFYLPGNSDSWNICAKCVSAASNVVACRALTSVLRGGQTDRQMVLTITISLSSRRPHLKSVVFSVEINQVSTGRIFESCKSVKKFAKLFSFFSPGDAAAGLLLHIGPTLPW